MFAEAEEFLAEKLPISGFMLPWTVGLLSIFLFFWSWYSEVDVISSARGVVISNSRIQVIQPRETNVVSKILVKEGEKVQKGQKLVEFLQKVPRIEIEKLEKEIQKAEAKIYRLSILIEVLNNGWRKPVTDKQNPYLSQELVILDHQIKNVDSELAAIDARIRALENSNQGLILEIDLLKELIPMTQTKLKRNTSLSQEGIIGSDIINEIKEKLVTQIREVKIK
ncbi:MAG: hypothetical protein GY786_10335, partial [Proteobacteria bacterium]|nr:hypothetical protein [Pseudomonadota bacterium]